MAVKAHRPQQKKKARYQGERQVRVSHGGMKLLCCAKQPSCLFDRPWPGEEASIVENVIVRRSRERLGVREIPGG